MQSHHRSRDWETSQKTCNSTLAYCTKQFLTNDFPIARANSAQKNALGIICVINSTLDVIWEVSPCEDKTIGHLMSSAGFCARLSLQHAKSSVCSLMPYLNQESFQQTTPKKARLTNLRERGSQLGCEPPSVGLL